MTDQQRHRFWSKVKKTPRQKPSDRRTWEDACERVWSEAEFEPCKIGDEDICGELQIPPSDYICTFHQNGRERIYPPIGDAAACMAMWNYVVLTRGCAVSHFDGMLSVQVPCKDRMAYEKEQIGIEGDEDLSDELYMANMVAAAVCALPKEHKP